MATSVMLLPTWGGAATHTTKKVPPVAQVPSGLANSVARLFHKGTFQLSMPGSTTPQPAMTLAKYGAQQKRPLLVLLWGRYCGPCLAELATVNVLKKALKSRVSFDVIAICLDDIGDRQGLPTDVPLYQQITLNEYLNNPEPGALNVTSIPYALIIGPQGQFQGYVHVGMMDFTSTKVQNLLVDQLRAVTPAPALKKGGTAGHLKIKTAPFGPQQRRNRTQTKGAHSKQGQAVHQKTQPRAARTTSQPAKSLAAVPFSAQSTQKPVSLCLNDRCRTQRTQNPWHTSDTAAATVLAQF